MKKYLQNFLLLLVSITACSVVLAQPKIKIINPIINLGEVHYSKESVVARIEVTNEGTETLVINDIKPDCGCTIAEMLDKEIEPGDTSVVIATLRLNTLSGNFSKSIVITSNDTSVYASKITLNVSVIRQFEAVPRYMTFDRVVVGQPARAEIIIKNNSNTDAVVKNVSFSREGIICNLSADDVLKKGESFKLIATAIAIQPGSIRSELTIELFHPEEKIMKIYIYGNAIEDKK